MSYEFAIFLSQSANAVQFVVGFVSLFAAVAFGVASGVSFVEKRYLLSSISATACVAFFASMIGVVSCGCHEYRKPLIDATYGRVSVSESENRGSR